MKLSRLYKFIIILFFSSLVIFIIYCKSKEAETSVEIHYIRAFDKRLPALSNKDIDEVFKEAEKMIGSKFSSKLKIKFIDHGTISLNDFFNSISYSESPAYKTRSPWKYLIFEEDQPAFKRNDFPLVPVKYLKDWSVEDLSKFFPEKKISSHEEAYTKFLEIYKDKIKWQKSLKTNKGENLLIYPPEKFQSYVEWLSLMYVQDKYDVVFTNTLITADDLSQPPPHSIMKHAKIGGSSFDSPFRSAFSGKSLMVNILEQYGEVDGISMPKTQDRSLTNKVLGGLLFAHEFGHAFYLMPDFYDHPDECLMNSTMENLKDTEGYEILLKHPGRCPSCQPWLDSKNYFLLGESSIMQKNYPSAKEFFIKAKETLPEHIDGDRSAYIKFLETRASSSNK